jgi:hypothetical protein
MTSFTKVILFTGQGGRAAFREESIPLNEGNPNVQLSSVLGSTGLQLRHSPVGFTSQVHVTGTPQWVFILKGAMEIVLLDGTTRLFNAGDHFYSADTLPEGATFDPKVHGHWSRQVGDEPLVTLFVKE